MHDQRDMLFPWMKCEWLMHPHALCVFRVICLSASPLTFVIDILSDFVVAPQLGQVSRESAGAGLQRCAAFLGWHQPGRLPGAQVCNRQCANFPIQSPNIA